MFTTFEAITPKEILPGFKARFIHTASQTLSLVTIEEGAVLPEHAHMHEQISQVLEGSFELTVGKETRVCSPGDIALIDSNVPHSGKALTACTIFDIFTPVREDYQSL
ncbi:MAG: cupin domain-containing protein [Bacteroidota bacterium]